MQDSHTTSRSTDTDQSATPTESSPSAGAAEVAEVMGVAAGRGTEECDVEDCDRAGDRLQVLDAPAAADPEPVREGVRCDAHAKDFLEVSS